MINHDQTISSLTADSVYVSFDFASDSSIHHEQNVMMSNQFNKLSGNSTPIK